MRVCLLEEGKVYDLREVVGSRCRDVEERELGESITFMRAQIEGFSRLFRRKSKMSFGFSVRLDAPAPRVVGGKLFSGFWSGVFVYSPRSSSSGAGGEPIYIVIEPRVKNYHGMLSLIEEVLFSFGDFQLLTHAAPLLSPTLLSLDAIRSVLLEVQLLLEREPKLLSQLVASESGEFLDVSVGGRGIAYKALSMRRQLNFSLALSLAVAARSTANALGGCKSILGELGSALEELRSEQGSAQGDGKAGESLLKAIEKYVLRMKSYLSALLSDEFIAYSLSSLDAVGIDEIGLEKYWHVVHAARAVGRSTQWSESYFGRSRQFLLPSTKVYELYVYAALVDALRRELEGDFVEECGTLALCIGGTELFFNHYPERFSKIIRAISRATPSPDIFYSADRLAAPIECKYRELGDPKLRLGDAERLLSYLADSSKDEKLKAIVVSLSATTPGCVKASIDGRKMEVCFAEMNPDKPGERESQAQQILSLLTS